MNGELTEREALAAEYVLGTLDPEGRRQAERLIAEDPDFAKLVGVWNQRLGLLLQAIPSETPSAEVWQRIQAALEARAPATLAAPRRPIPPQKVPLLERLGFWRWCTLGASAVAAALALYIAVQPIVPPAGPTGRYVAVLNQDGSDPAWLVTVDLTTQQLTIRPVAEAAAGEPDKALELWLVAADGAEPPRSLGHLLLLF